MKRAEVTFKFLTPALLAGADQKSAEMRASSIRGALRWWMNALGYDKDCINDLFGTAAGETGRRSRVIVRDTTDENLSRMIKERQTADMILNQNKPKNKPDYFLWPLGKPENARGVIQAGSTASFSVFLRSGESEDLEKGLKAFLLLGSLGSRSRRCYGSIWPVSVTIDKKPWQFPKNTAEMKHELALIFDQYANMEIDSIGDRSLRDWKFAVETCSNFLKSYRCGSPKSGEPSAWGENDHDAPFGKTDCVYRPILGLPLTQTYSSSGRTVTSQIEGYDRLASPVHFKVVSLDGGFLPVVFFCYSMIPDDDTVVSLVEKNRTIYTRPLDTELFYEMSDNSRLNSLGDFRYNGD